MNGENIQSIIVVKEELKLGCEIADGPADNTEANGGSYKNITLVRNHEPDMIYVREPT